MHRYRSNNEAAALEEAYELDLDEYALTVGHSNQDVALDDTSIHSDRNKAPTRIRHVGGGIMNEYNANSAAGMPRIQPNWRQHDSKLVCTFELCQWSGAIYQFFR